MDDRQIIDEFVVESCDHLADIESQLLAIEAGGQTADIELVNTVFARFTRSKGPPDSFSSHAFKSFRMNWRPFST